MGNKLSQKTAIITGGAIGLGFAMAQKFAEHNVRVHDQLRRQSDSVSRYTNVSEVILPANHYQAIDYPRC